MTSREQARSAGIDRRRALGHLFGVTGTASLSTMAESDGCTLDESGFRPE